MCFLHGNNYGRGLDGTFAALADLTQCTSLAIQLIIDGLPTEVLPTAGRCC